MDYNTLKQFEGKWVGINHDTPMYLVRVDSYNRRAVFAKSMAGNFFFYYDLGSIASFYVAEEDVPEEDLKSLKDREEKFNVKVFKE